jgi:hypothetical protein
MDDESRQAGQELNEQEDRTPEQVREEIEQTREELGETVEALAAKTDVKAQAKQATDNAKETVGAKVSDLKGTVTGKKDEFVSAAQEATPGSAAEAGQRVQGMATENRHVLVPAAAFAVGLIVGRWSSR